MSVSEPLLVDHASLALLPSELIDALNQTYFLHLLITEPRKVIPPGKSLLSMMTQANFKASDDDKPKQDRQAQIADRVKEVAHKAFWNEVNDQSFVTHRDLCLCIRVGDRGAFVFSTFCPIIAS